jgi:hypothetical protein
MVRKLIISVFFLLIGGIIFGQNFFFNQHAGDQSEPEPEPIMCDETFSFGSGQSYPTDTLVFLGEATGTSNFTFDAISVPDRLIIYFDGNVAYDTGYRGTWDYDYLGSDRYYFTNSLNGRIDPITGNTYPDLITYPEDGYPRVTPGVVNYYFTKATATTTCEVKIYAPVGGTAWSCHIHCPE